MVSLRSTTVGILDKLISGTKYPANPPHPKSLAMVVERSRDHHDLVAESGPP
ncbi:MAG: hypothetical protein V1775_08810 [Bacteroidota bacterium]